MTGVGNPKKNQMTGVGNPKKNQMTGVGNPKKNQMTGVGNPKKNPMTEGRWKREWVTRIFSRWVVSDTLRRKYLQTWDGILAEKHTRVVNNCQKVKDKDIRHNKQLTTTATRKITNNKEHINKHRYLNCGKQTKQLWIKLYTFANKKWSSWTKEIFLSLHNIKPFMSLNIIICFWLK